MRPIRPTLTLYGHDYCHLCTEMYAALEARRDAMGFDLELVDIEGNAELEAKFAERVPVLLQGGEEICHYVLDEEALRACLERAGRA